MRREGVESSKELTTRSVGDSRQQRAAEATLVDDD